jgi:uncharacterized protein YndB with AHSA1/START domain
MADNSIVRVTHRYAVPAERVFDAWITPAQAGRFLFTTRTGNVLHCETDPRVGGSFFVTDRRPNADGDESFFEAQHRGVYVELNRPRRLAFDLALGPLFEDATRVTIDIAPGAGNTCELTLTHDLDDSAGSGEEAEALIARTRQIWNATLDKLDKVLTTRIWGFRVPGSA